MNSQWNEDKILFNFCINFTLHLFPFLRDWIFSMGNFRAYGYHFLFLMYFLPINLIILVIELFRAENITMHL